MGPLWCVGHGYLAVKNPDYTVLDVTAGIFSDAKKAETHFTMRTEYVLKIIDAAPLQRDSLESHGITSKIKMHLGHVASLDLLLTESNWASTWAGLCEGAEKREVIGVLRRLFRERELKSRLSPNRRWHA